MSRPPQLGRTSLLLITLGLTVAVFAARETSTEASDGIALLYLLPVALVALEFGLIAGLAFAAGALALVGLWDLTSTASLSLVGYAARGSLFFGAAWLCARMAERVRRVARDGDHYFQLGDDMICVIDAAGWFTRVNDRWHDVMGWDEGDMLGHRLLELVHMEDRERTKAELARIFAGERATPGFTNRLATRYGEWRHIEWSARYASQEHLMYAAARDVTERQRLAIDRMLTQERLNAVFDGAMSGMAVVGLRGDDAGKMVQSNHALATILGVSEEEMLGSFTFSAYVHPEDIPDMAETMRPLAEGTVDTVDGELRILRPDGEIRWLQLRASALHDEHGDPRYRLSQVMDITEIKANEQQLRHLADHDPLSWLFNRRRFTADLEQELHANALRGSRAAVLVIDLDGFKQVNDQAGHGAGDEVIKTVAIALIRRLRSGDVAGRLGGDEFGVLLRRVDPEQAVMVSHDLRAAVHEAVMELDQEVARQVTMSVGVTVVNGDGRSTADEVLDRADRAMYRAKAEGGGRVALAAFGTAPTA